MGCATSAYTALPSALSRATSRASGRDDRPSRQIGPRRLSLRPHSLETRILQVDQVDSLQLEPAGNTEPEVPFADGRLGLRDLSPTETKRWPKGMAFSDPAFPADDSALGVGCRQPAGIQWCRPAEVGAKGPVWSGTSRGRVQAGLFDDRWLAEAMAVVARRPHLLDKVFGAETPVGLQGAVRVRLWRFGRWETVVVDDRIPVPHGISSQCDGEVWPAVLEKAFAKIHGGYSGLSGGDVLWGLEDLTGGLSQRLQLPTGTSASTGSVQSLYGHIYRPVVQALRVGALVSCAPILHQQKSVKREIFVSIVVETKLTISGPEVCVQDEVGSSSSHWLSLEDFVAAYTDIIITTLTTGSEHLQVQEVFGWWETGISSGGSRNNLEKFATNPQYVLTITQPEDHEEDKDFGRCNLLMALMQEHRRSAKACRPPLLPIAYFIYKAEILGERLTAEYFLCVQEEMDTGPFKNKREIAHHAELAPGDYIVIPAVWSAGQQAGFLLRIFTLRKVILKALPPYKPIYAMLPTWVPENDT